jgi:hypothetical protein
MNKSKRVARLKQRQNKKRFEALRRTSDLDETTVKTRRVRSVVSNAKEASPQDLAKTKSPKRTRIAKKVEVEATLKVEPQAEEIESSDTSEITNKSSEKSSPDKSESVEQPKSPAKEKPKRTRATSKKSAEEEKPKRARSTVKKTGDA